MAATQLGHRRGAMDYLSPTLLFFHVTDSRPLVFFPFLSGNHTVTSDRAQEYKSSGEVGYAYNFFMKYAYKLISDTLFKGADYIYFQRQK